MAPSSRSFDGCLYTGYPGVAWAAFYISTKSNIDPAVRSDLQNKALYMINAALQHSENIRANQWTKEHEHSLLLGQVGIIMTAAMIYSQLGDESKLNFYIDKYAALAENFQKKGTLFSQGSDELFIGRAGYLTGLAALRHFTGKPVLSDEYISKIGDAVVCSGLDFIQKNPTDFHLMYSYYGTKYLGAAHGLVGILFALMCFPKFLTPCKNSITYIKNTVDCLIRTTPADTGNLYPAIEDMRCKMSYSSMLVHWCHGATGAIFLYARCYLLWKETRYLDECRRCCEVIWQYGLLKKGPGICHGVAGSGYAFLLMYRLTKEKIYLDRAAAFLHFMNSSTFKAARRPDSPYSLYEGLAGTACFYADFAHPDTAAFPLMDPFWAL